MSYLQITEYLQSITDWLNQNQGFVTVVIFVFTALYGWLSGTFSALRGKPKFKIDLIPGPTFVCTFPTGEMCKEQDVHRVGISLYLSIANCGSVASSVHEVHVGYRRTIVLFNKRWPQKLSRPHWLKNQIAALEDFQSRIGESIKVYPFLFQKNALLSESPNTYLQSGQSVIGVVYFEQADSFGSFQPLVTPKGAYLTVCVLDVFGHKHKRSFWVPSLTFERAREFNPAFGRTLSELNANSTPAKGS